jgi:hypothetical protein
MKLKQVIKDYPITLTASVNVMLAGFQCAFTQPSFGVFSMLFTGAVLVRGRHTVSRMLVAAGVRASRHARFHRFFRAGRWTMDQLWECFAQLVVQQFVGAGEPLRLAVDDTAQRKTGAKIYGVGVVLDNRPALHKSMSFCWGLTWVIATLLIRVPLWKGRLFALPVMARLYRKEKLCRRQKRPFKTKGALALEMIEAIAAWFPQCKMLLHVDGGYAGGDLMKHLPQSVEVLGRARWDAALYALPPARTSKGRGRPRIRGRRLPTPREMAEQPGQGQEAWRRLKLRGGKLYEIRSWVVLRPKVFGSRPIRLVATRRAKPDAAIQFFYCTDLKMEPHAVVRGYDDRWAIEMFFHELKERMGFEHPQCWTEQSVERTAPFLLLVAGLVQHWFLSQNDPRLIGFRPRWLSRQRRESRPPSFSEMLAALRRHILGRTFSCRSSSRSDLLQNIRALVDLAAYAA